MTEPNRCVVLMRSLFPTTTNLTQAHLDTVEQNLEEISSEIEEREKTASELKKNYILLKNTPASKIDGGSTAAKAGISRIETKLKSILTGLKHMKQHESILLGYKLKIEETLITNQIGEQIKEMSSQLSGIPIVDVDGIDDAVDNIQEIDNERTDLLHAINGASENMWQAQESTIDSLMNDYLQEDNTEEVIEEEVHTVDERIKEDFDDTSSLSSAMNALNKLPNVSSDGVEEPKKNQKQKNKYYTIKMDK